MRTTTRLCGIIVLTMCAFHNTQAALIYDEGVSGDLSNDNLAPNLLAVSAGSNVVRGGTTAVPFDRDIFSFSIAADQQLVAIILDTYISGDDQSFFAVAAGNTISSLFSTPALLGNALIGASVGNMEGDDVLDDLGALTFPGSAGFAGALGPGDYTFWIQETTVGIREYALDFQVRGPATVPLPSTFFLLLPVLALLGKYRAKT
jgi:hypothetical protein